jgi:hypothetical protein
MTQIIQQWISRAIALGVMGPAAAYISNGLKGVDGSGDHTLLASESISSGFIALVLVGLCAAVSGVIGGTIGGGRRESFLAIGFVLGWVAWTSGRMGHVLMLSPEIGTMLKLAIEGVLLGVFVIVSVALVSRSDEQDPMTSFSPKRVLGWLTQAPMLGAMGAGLVACGVIAMVFAVYDYPGQSTGVGFIAGIFAGLAGTLVAGSMAGKDEHKGTGFAPIMIGVMLAGVVFPLVGIVYPGFGSIDAMVLKGELPGIVMVSPTAWIVGAMLGVPIGHSWVEHSQAKVQDQGAPSK